MIFAGVEIKDIMGWSIEDDKRHNQKRRILIEFYVKAQDGRNILIEYW